MSMTRDQLPSPPYEIQALPGALDHLLRSGIERYRRSFTPELLYGVANTGLYLTDGGFYDFRKPEYVDLRIYTIEQILQTRPTPSTTHSHWSSE